MVKEKLGAALKGVCVDQGIGGPEPGSRAIYAVMTHLLFDSLEAFQGAFGPQAEAVMADIPNCTNIEPAVQISEAII
jgi:uncharacterized protein (TIGR02118 family)